MNNLKTIGSLQTSKADLSDLILNTHTPTTLSLSLSLRRQGKEI